MIKRAAAAGILMSATAVTNAAMTQSQDGAHYHVDALEINGLAVGSTGTIDNLTALPGDVIKFGVYAANTSVFLPDGTTLAPITGFTTGLADPGPFGQLLTDFGTTFDGDLNVGGIGDVVFSETLGVNNNGINLQVAQIPLFGDIDRSFGPAGLLFTFNFEIDENADELPDPVLAYDTLANGDGIGNNIRIADDPDDDFSTVTIDFDTVTGDMVRVPTPGAAVGFMAAGLAATRRRRA